MIFVIYIDKIQRMQKYYSISEVLSLLMILKLTLSGKLLNSKSPSLQPTSIEI